MGAYPKAIRKEFGRHGHSPHKLVPNIRAEESNNLVERLHGTEKSRTKVMRAFDQETGAAAIMDGWRVHYDVVRMHQALGKTPAEAADIAPLVGFKWHELLKLAITRNVTADKQQTASTR
jgi:transposase-like protein